MKLSDLLSGIPKITIPPERDVNIEGLTEDSREVKKGFLFFARRGFKTSGIQYIDEALKRGAASILADDPSIVREKTFYVPSLSQVQRSVAKKFYGTPSEQMTVVGVTGTNGKTTFTYLMESVAKQIGWRVGVIGTVNIRLPGEDSNETQTISSVNTTPNFLEILKTLALMRVRGVDLVVMEVSSHALAQDRTKEIDFDGAVFTNLTQDHLDFHKNMESYFTQKAKLFQTMYRKKKGFKGAPAKFSILNSDDLFGRRLIPLSAVPVVTYGMNSDADFLGRDLILNCDGTEFTLCRADSRTKIQIPLLGKHNVYNALSAIATSVQLGIPMSVIAQGLKKIEPIPGRLEAIVCGQKFTVLVDYAHTEDALKNVLQSLRPLAKRRILTLFGCGGDRDPGKRPLMGKVASLLSDWVVITSDNPRSEDPLKIIRQIESGIKRLKKKNYTVIEDRIRAIEEILKMGEEKDIILIAGKGHETVQIFKDKTVPHDDRVCVREILCSH